MVTGLLAGVLVTLALVAANPSPQDFKGYLRERIPAEARREGMGGLVPAAGALGLLDLASSAAASAAVRSDYLLFSIYRLDVQGRHYAWLGVARRFIPLGP